MPEFTLEFEVYCARCNAGLCNQSTTRLSRARNYPQVVVEPCQKCLEEESANAASAAVQKAEEPLYDQIADLKDEIAELKRELELYK